MIVDESVTTAGDSLGKLPPALSPCFVPTHRKSSVQVHGDDIAAALYRYVTSGSRDLSLVVLQPFSGKYVMNVTTIISLNHHHHHHHRHHHHHE